MFAMRSKIPSGAAMPVLGLGTWRMGESQRRRAQELDAVRYGLDLGCSMIDTAEMYGEGGAEEMSARRSRAAAPAYIVSKVYPHNARARHRRRLRAQPQALGVERIDLYLWHWGGARLEETSRLARLRDAGKIAISASATSTRRHGEAARLDKGQTGSNQVSTACRGAAEFDLLPWMRRRSIPLMAYCRSTGRLLRQSALKKSPTKSAARRLSRTRLAVGQAGVVTIPKSPAASA